MRGGSALIKTIIFTVLPGLFTLGALEAGAYLMLWTQQREVPYESPAFRELQVGLHPWAEVTRIPVTHEGYHPYEPDPATPKNDCRHLVVTGDSQTFGIGVNGDETFTALLRERFLEDRRCIRVYNIAYPGDGPVEQTRRLVETFDVLRPDVVVLVAYSNDLTQIVDHDALAYVPMGFDVEQMHIVRVLRWHRWAWMYRNGETTMTLFPGLWPLPDTLPKEIQAEASKRYQRWLGRLRAWLQSRGVSFGVAALSGFENVRSGLHWEADTIESIARGDGVAMLKTYPHFAAHREQYPFVMYEGHYNAAGHRVIAGAMYDWLLGDEHGAPRFQRLKAAAALPSVPPPSSNLPESAR